MVYFEKFPEKISNNLIISVLRFLRIVKSFPKEKSSKKGSCFLGYKKCFPYSSEKYPDLSFVEMKNLCNFAAVKPSRCP